MTRERYCKLIQGYGYQRNVADKSAAKCRSRGQSYAHHWSMIVRYHEQNPKTGSYASIFHRYGYKRH